MNIIKLTVFFDEPFWVGVFERIEGGKLAVSRIVFGAEPKDYGIYSYVLENYNKISFRSSLKVDAEIGKRINPKRLQRIVRNQTSSEGIGTKAQQAMKLQQEAQKQEHKKLSKERREELEKLKFQKYQEKKKEKKKGH